MRRTIAAAKTILSLLLVVTAGGGCAHPTAIDDPGTGTPDPGADTTGADTTGEVQFELTTVPTGVQCLRVSLAPATGNPVVQTYPLTAGGSSASLSLTALPQGSLTMTAAAYNAACTGLGSAMPTWIADPITATIRAGVVTKVSLTLRANNAVSTSVNFVPNIQSIAAGGFNTFILTGAAPLQFGYLAYNNLPTPIPAAPTNFTAIASGAYHACGIRADGTVWCWGWNLDGAVGPNVALNNVSQTPVQVPLTGTYTMIAAGLFHTCALKAGAANSLGDQSVYCWGRNDRGQLGNGTTTNSATPVQVIGIAGLAVRAIRSLSSGDWHTIAVAGDGNYVAWGDNGFGQIGDGTTTTALTGKYVANATPTIVAAVGGTGHSCSLHADSSVRCWGANFSGQLGDGTITQRFSPVKVQGLSVAVKQLVAGENHNCALLVNGQVYCWGTDREGELGDLAGQDRWLPVPVSFGAETALSIASGAQHTCALTSGPGLWCWGMNDEGQIGDGSNYYAFGPTKVMLQ